MRLPAHPRPTDPAGPRRPPLRGLALLGLAAACAGAGAAPAGGPADATPVAATTPAPVAADAAAEPTPAPGPVPAPAPASAPAPLPAPTSGVPVVPAAAAAAETGRSRWSYVLGATLNEGPTYAGSDRQSLRLRPLWSLQVGRLRLSTSGARAVGALDGGDAAAGSGASLDLLDRGGWRVGTSLRLDGGRSASDDPALAGLPEIRRTLRGRLYASHRLDPHWGLGLGVSTDLLGRHGGTLANAGLGYGNRLGDLGTWGIGGGLTWGDATYLRTHHGIDAASALATGRRAYEPGAGWVSASLGASALVPLGPHWALLGGAGVGRLLGAAADSPLTQRRTTWQLSIGLAWRDRSN